MPDDELAQETAVVKAAPDWNAIRESYLQGKPSEEIAKEHDVSLYAIRGRAQNQGWREMQAIAQSLARQEVGNRIRNALSTSLLRDALTFQTFEMPPISSEEHEIASRNRARLIDSAAKLLGWGEESGPLDAMKQAKVLDV